MDPLLENFKYVDSFNLGKNTTKMYINKYYQENFIHLTPNIQVKNIVDYINEPINYVDKVLYDDAFYLSPNKHNINYFINQQITTYANIDAVYNITEILSPHIFRQNNLLNFRYMVVDDQGGDFVRYVQYRKPNAYGVGITKGHDWDYKYINTTLFNPYDGYDLSGNVIVKENWENLIEAANGDIQERYNLVVCNRHIKEDYNRRELELLYVQSLIIQCIIGLSCSVDKFVVHCYDITSTVNAQILFILSLCFTSISIIKPFVDHINTSDRYVVCEGIKYDQYNDVKNYVKPYTELLKDATNYFTSNTYISSLFSNPLPDDFVTWLTDRNNEVLEYQLTSFDNYYFDTASVYLNIPDNITVEPINTVMEKKQ